MRQKGHENNKIMNVWKMGVWREREREREREKKIVLQYIVLSFITMWPIYIG